MEKRIKQALNGAIVTSILFIILGILFIVFPESFLDILRWIVAALCFLGAFSALLVKAKTGGLFGSTVLAAILVAIGLIFATQPAVTNIFAIILGAWFIVSSVISSSMISSLKGGMAFFSGLMSFVSLVCGIILIINPWGASISIMMLIGIVTIVHAVSTLIDTLILRSNLKELKKRFKSRVIEGKEA